MTMTLLESIASAKASKVRWNVRIVTRILEDLVKAVPNSHLEWEQDDEMWARVLLDGEAIACLSAEFPLLLLRADLAPTEWAPPLPNYVVLFTHQRFDDKAFAAPRQELERLFERPLTRNLDYQHFSINDLWWATVH